MTMAGPQASSKDHEVTQVARTSRVSSGSSSCSLEDSVDFAAGMLSRLNASPASRSIGIPGARASLSASMRPLDSPFVNPGIHRLPGHPAQLGDRGDAAGEFDGGGHHIGFGAA